MDTNPGKPPEIPRESDFKETSGTFALTRQVTDFARGGSQIGVPLHDKPLALSHVQAGLFSWRNGVANKILGLPPAALPGRYLAGGFSVFPSRPNILLDHLENTQSGYLEQLTDKSLDVKRYVVKFRARPVPPWGGYPLVFLRVESFRGVEVRKRCSVRFRNQSCMQSMMRKTARKRSGLKPLLMQ